MMRRDSAVPADIPLKEMSKPPGLAPLPIAILLTAWFLFVVIFFSDVDSNLDALVVLVYGSLLWLFVWLIRLIVSLVRQRRGTIARQGLRHALRYWGVEPAALLLCGVLAITGVLFYPRFWLCRASLDAYVADVVAGRVQPHDNETPRHWVGLFRVSEVELQPGGVVRMITTPVLLDDAGLTYSPVSAPPRIGEDSYRHITGAWYRWHRSW
jgi:hypothetical protein